MKSIILVILVAFVLFSCAAPEKKPEPTPAPTEKFPSLKEAMDKMAGSLPTEKKQVVAVFSFSERGRGPTLLGEYVAEKLMISLSATGRVELVERNRLETVTQEQKLGATGLIDDSTAASIGNVAGAQAALVGTLTPLEDCWELSARLLGTSDARVLAIADARFSAQSVPPNLAGQPLTSSSRAQPEQTKSVQQEQPPATKQRPAQVQETPTRKKPALNVIFKKCLQFDDPRARRKCFNRFREIIMSDPVTPQKAAARKCLQIPNPRQRTRCLKKVLSTSQQ
ncbi:MAG: hypothetical protein ISS66_12285 [Desulfobacteraceae bacterium]|nr:hypothetical protein [Desulfobacteraceae bacterium]